MTNDQKRAMMAEILEYQLPPLREEGDITWQDYQEFVLQTTGRRIPETSARRHLKREVEAGRLKRLRGVVDPESNRQVTVWRKADAS